jgi:hypothetical protein
MCSIRENSQFGRPISTVSYKMHLNEFCPLPFWDHFGSERGNLRRRFDALRDFPFLRPYILFPVVW